MAFGEDFGFAAALIHAVELRAYFNLQRLFSPSSENGEKPCKIKTLTSPQSRLRNVLLRRPKPWLPKNFFLAQKADQHEGKSRRARERFRLALPVRVRGRESPDHEWSEMSRLVDVTPFGARLRLSRPTETGRLLHLTLPMPRPLRCFDHVEEQYRVWSLVRNVRILDPSSEQGALVEIGVAFVGKWPPQSFETDPTRRYEIARTAGAAGLWSVKEESSEVLSDVAITDKRKESRHVIPIEVLVEVFGKDKGFSDSEKTVTENISLKGASIFSTLDLAPGRFVKISSEQYRASVLAVVRARHIGADGIPRLQLEFVGGEWPL